MESKITTQAIKNANRRAKTLHYIIVDVVDAPMGRGPSYAFRDECEKYKICWKLLDRHGKNGHPTYELSGSKANLVKWLKEIYVDEGFLSSLVNHR